jgi:ATP-dependent RNA helicase RhlE
MRDQVQALHKNPRVIIATPGRLLDHMGQWNVMPNEVVMLVLDEADRMLDMGFAPQIEKILRFLPKERQTMLFSATMPKEIMGIAAKYMKLPLSVEVAPSGTTAEHITQEVFIVKKESKTQLLSKILSQYHGSVLLFSRTKYNAKKITVSIRNMGHNAAEIHSNRSLAQRREALEGFKSGKYKVLVATDIASRGIDVTGIELVINYDLPEDAENYVHRIGRTGRAGLKGHAISFATPDQSRDIRDIENLIKTTLPLSKHPGISLEKFSQSTQSAPDKHSRGGFNRNRSSQRHSRHEKDPRHRNRRF